MKTTIALLAVLLAAAPLLAQRPGSRSFVTDDDDGKVEIYRHGDAPAAAALRQPVVEILFAGSGWDRATREALTAHLRTSAIIAGAREVAAPPRANDLHVQAILERALRDRGGDVIHVVFLGRNVVSTLGASQPGRDYDSYHSTVHVHDTSVRYVVVPWNDDAALVREAAAESVARAIAP